MLKLSIAGTVVFLLLATSARAAFNCSTTTSGGQVCCGTASNGLSGCCWFEGKDSTCVWNRTVKFSDVHDDLTFTASQRFRAALEADRNYEVATGLRPNFGSKWYTSIGVAYLVPGDRSESVIVDGVAERVTADGRSGQLGELSIGFYFNRSRTEFSIGESWSRYEIGRVASGVNAGVSDARTRSVVGRFLYDLRRTGQIQPYLGAGLGYYSLDLRSFDSLRRRSDESTRGVLYQAELGVTVPISSRTAVVPAIRYASLNHADDSVSSEGTVCFVISARLSF